LGRQVVKTRWYALSTFKDMKTAVRSNGILFVVLAVLAALLVVHVIDSRQAKEYKTVMEQQKDSLMGVIAQMNEQEKEIVGQLVEKQKVVDSLVKNNAKYKMNIVLLKEKHKQEVAKIKQMSSGELYEAFMIETAGDEPSDTSYLIPVSNIRTAVVIFSQLDEAEQTIFTYEEWIDNMDSLYSTCEGMNLLYREQVSVLTNKYDSMKQYSNIQQSQLESTQDAFRKFKIGAYVAGALIIGLSLL
jgi:hypothetical protein